MLIVVGTLQRQDGGPLTLTPEGLFGFKLTDINTLRRCTVAAGDIG